MSIYPVALIDERVHALLTEKPYSLLELVPLLRAKYPTEDFTYAEVFGALHRLKELGAVKGAS